MPVFFWIFFIFLVSTPLKANDVKILDLLLKCKTDAGSAIRTNGGSMHFPKQEIFISIKIFNLSKPFKVSSYRATQKANISIDGYTYYETSEMVSYVGIPSPNGALTTMTDEEFSFVNSSSKYSPESWGITINRITGRLKVLGWNQSQGFNLLNYVGKCKKVSKKKLF